MLVVFKASNGGIVVGTLFFLFMGLWSNPLRSEESTTPPVSAPVASEAQEKCKKGDNKSCAEIPMESAEAGDMYKSGCDRKHGYSCARLGQWFEVTKDSAKALESYKRACGFGEKLACDWQRDLQLRLCYLEAKDDFCGKAALSGAWVIIDLFRFPDRTKVYKQKTFDFTLLKDEQEKAYRAALMSGNPKIAEVIVEIHKAKRVTGRSAEYFYRDVQYLFTPTFPAALVSEVAKIKRKRKQPSELDRFFPAKDETIFCEGRIPSADRATFCESKSCIQNVVAYYEKAQKNIEAAQVTSTVQDLKDDFITLCKANIVRLQITKIKDLPEDTKKRECGPADQAVTGSQENELRTPALYQ